MLRTDNWQRAGKVGTCGAISLGNRLNSPSWSVTGSGLWLECPGSLSKSQRPGCDWHSALCRVLYVWPVHLKLTKLGLFLQLLKHPKPWIGKNLIEKVKLSITFWLSNLEVFKVRLQVSWFSNIILILVLFYVYNWNNMKLSSGVWRQEVFTGFCADLWKLSTPSLFW